MEGNESGLKRALRMIGPAAILTAGIMGAGSTTSLLLGGAYFGYDLLWAAVITLPIVVVCQDTAARIGAVSEGKGMMTVIAERFHPSVMWTLLVPTCLIAIVANGGQLGAMYDSTLTILTTVCGFQIPAQSGGGVSAGKVVILAILSLLTLAGVIVGGYKSVEKIMKYLLVVISVSFFIVAAGAFASLDELRKMLGGLCFIIPADGHVIVKDELVTRSGMGYLASIAGGAVAATAILSYPYFTAEAGHHKRDLRLNFWNNFWTFGVIFGLYSIVLLVAGAYRLNPRSDALAIQNSCQAGVVLNSVLGPVGTAAFAVGLFSCAYSTLIVVAQLISYFLLDACGCEWRFNLNNKKFLVTFVAMVIVPAMFSSIWDFPEMLKVVVSMMFSTLITPFAIILLIWLINNKAVAGEHRAGLWRNLFLVYSLAFCLWTAYRAGGKFIDDFPRIFKFLN